MNCSTNERPEIIISIKQLIWDLLSQWKAVIIIALLMSMLAAGLKYYSSLQSYSRSLDDQKKEYELAAVSPQEQADILLGAVPEKDRELIEYVVEQKEWIDTEKRYINESLLINENPTNQRTLIADYYLKSENSQGTIAATLGCEYKSFLQSGELVDALKNVLAPDADEKYIAELILCTDKAIFADDGDLVLECRIVLPEKVNADAVEKTLTNALKKHSAEICGIIEPHTISLINAEEVMLYNSEAVSTRNSIIASIYNLENTYIKNTENSMTAEQKTLADKLLSVREASSNKTELGELPHETIERPGIEWKYAFVGFVLGIMMYALIYAVYVVVRGKISSAEDVEYYTGSRLFGDIYRLSKVKGLSFLTKSKFINRLRYNKKLDSNRQIEKTVDAIDAVCRYGDISKLTVIQTGDTSPEDKLSQSIIQKIRNKGLELTIKDFDDSTAETDILDIGNVVLMLNNDTKVSDILMLKTRLNEYGRQLLGSIYIGCI